MNSNNQNPVLVNPTLAIKLSGDQQKLFEILGLEMLADKVKIKIVMTLEDKAFQRVIADIIKGLRPEEEQLLNDFVTKKDSQGLIAFLKNRVGNFNKIFSDKLNELVPSFHK